VSLPRRLTAFMQGRGPMRLAWALLPLFVTTYQITAKVIADGAGRAPNRAGLSAILSNPALVALVGSEIGSFVLWMYVLARMQLSEAFPLSAISYVFVLLSSWVVFHETGSVGQVIGSAAIVIGVWLIGRQPQRDT
jgi:drug/metabolite transporter (DMT)-like permease